MLTGPSLLFYCIFLSQVVLISYYFPKKVLARMNHVLETYPPAEYPKLYPQPHDVSMIGRWLFKWLNRLIFLLGFVVLAAIILLDDGTVADDGSISEAWPMAYGLLQFVPLVLLEIVELKQFKLMRQANVVATRKAELRRRRFFDFVSPWIFGVAVVLFLFAVLSNIYSEQFVVPWLLLLPLTASNLLMVAVGAWNLYGRKLNPHQAAEDRTRQTRLSLQSLLYVSIAMSLFFVWTAVDSKFDVDYLDAPLLSLYFQSIVFLTMGHLLRNLKVSDIDFAVYRDDPSPT